MYITKLRVKNYRNFSEEEIVFDPDINIIYGNNAEGKTNLLEAIFLCATSKSHKNSKDVEIINFNNKESHIKVFFYNETNKNKEQTIDIQLNSDIKKGIALNGIKIDKLSDFLGTLNAIIFAPEDLNIIKEGPAIRRKFIDMELCQIDKVYVSNITSYNKVLNQRNAILKDILSATGNNKSELINFLDTYDDQLIGFGLEVIIKRKKNIKELSEKIKDIYYKISGEKEELIIDYENVFFNNCVDELCDPEKIKKKYKEKLEETKEQDIKNGFTSIGPQRDDISFIVENNDLRKFGSQGQKKAAAISLKLSELLITKEKKRDTPILLLDDVFSELDEERQKRLIENINGIQTIITCTGMKRNIFDLLKPNKVFQVINNKVIEKWKV